MNQEIASILDLLAERFGTTVEYLWEVMIKQAYIGSIPRTAALIILVIGLVYGVKIIKYSLSHAKDEDWGEDFAGGIIAVTAVIMVVFFFVSIALLSGLATRLLNPEYWALQQILGVLQ